MQQILAWGRPLILAIAVLVGMGAAPLVATAQPMKAGWEAEWLKKAEAALKAKDFELARQDFQKAAILNPKSGAAYVGLGRVHRELGNESAAYKNFRTALEVEPDNLMALSEGGLAALALDKKQRAEEFRDRLSSLCGVSCNAYRTLSKAVRDYVPPEQPIIAEAPSSEEDAAAEDAAAPSEDQPTE